MASRECTKLKAEIRQLQDAFKKCDKERLEAKKCIEARDNAIEKMRKEKDELWIIVNTDKYKNVK